MLVNLLFLYVLLTLITSVIGQIPLHIAARLPYAALLGVKPNETITCTANGEYCESTVPILVQANNIPRSVVHSGAVSVRLEFTILDTTTAVATSFTSPQELRLHDERIPIKSVAPATRSPLSPGNKVELLVHPGAFVLLTDTVRLDVFHLVHNFF
jgi:hypothetical protein